MVGDEVGDAVGDDAGLAAAGPGQDEQGAFACLDGLTLRRVQAGQYVHAPSDGILASGQGVTQ